MEMFKLKSLLEQGRWMGLLICISCLTLQYIWLGYFTVNCCQKLQTTSNTNFIGAKETSDKDVLTTTPTSSTIYIITPTYNRPQQIAELTRLAQTLMHVPNIVWMIVEDAKTKTKAVESLLQRTGLPFVHLVAPMPKIYTKKKNINDRPRGVSNRVRALEWLRANATSGVLYFADDDNSYDIRIFEEMRDTKLVSMWPVALLLHGGFNSPIIRRGRIDKFYSSWTDTRKYQVDMAGFAVSVELLLKRPRAGMPYEVGREEEGFLKSLHILDDDIELKASNCTEVLVWHTQTRTPPLPRPPDITQYNGTNIMKLYSSIYGKT